QLALGHELAVVAEAERAAIDADCAVLRFFGLPHRPVLQLAEPGRFIFGRQPFLGGLKMWITGAAPPDVALGIVLLGLELGIDLAGALARHRHLDTGLALELRRHAAAPFLVDPAI